MSGLDGNPKVCCTAAQCPTGQTAGESAVCYRSTCPEGKKSTHFGGQSYQEHPTNSPRTPRRRPIAASVPRLDRTSRENPSPRTQQTPASHHQTLFHAARLCEMEPSAGTPKEGGVRSNRRPAEPMPTVGERHRSCHAALRRLAHGGGAHATIPRSSTRRQARRPRKTVAEPPHPLLPPRLQGSSRCMSLNRLCQLFTALAYC